MNNSGTSRGNDSTIAVIIIIIIIKQPGRDYFNQTEWGMAPF